MSKINVTRKAGSAIPVSPSLDVIEPRVSGHGQYPVNKRILYLSLQAVINAILVGFIAKLLVWLIALFTNLAFYGKFSFEEATPAGNMLGLTVLIVPVIGGLIVGIMAKFGSAAIRGHGIPEAMEQILVNESRMNPIIAFLKPLSAAIAIGTGGPFGAEGPIIATGGAFGSFIGQMMRITASERKIMLAAGATAGMSAIFGAPVAGVLLGIELLLFEFSPRSIIPVALACATGAAMHFALFTKEPMFAMVPIPEPDSIAMVVYVIHGVIIGVGASFLSKGVYFMEDSFAKLPVHWMWWPAIGGLAVGIIGYISPGTMGVGYNNITHLLTGSATLQFMLSLCFLKFMSWAVSLGSGTSGGTMAPIFTIGGAFGGLLGLLTITLFPQSGINIATCVLIGMAAMFAGATRALLTSIVFALETTMQPHGLLPLLGACTASYFISFFLMKKGTIMTEKIQRRGVHAPQSYEPDILQRIDVSKVMKRDPKVLSVHNTVKEVREWVKANADAQRSVATFIIVNDKQGLIGMIKREDLFSKKFDDDKPVTELVKGAPIYVYPDTLLSNAVDLMDEYHLDLVPVVKHDKDKKIVGVITYKEVFTAYSKRRNEEEIYKQPISLKYKSSKIIIRGKQFWK